MEDFSNFFRKVLKMKSDPQLEHPDEGAGESDLRAFKLGSAHWYSRGRGKGEMHPSKVIWKQRKRVQNQKVLVVQQRREGIVR